MRIHGFPPIAYKTSRILILGSMPGPDSLEKHEYYGNAQNAFWKILERFYKRKLLNYADKIRLLHDAGIALWDVLKTCARDGASDSSIRGAQLNDIPAFLKKYARIQKVLLNGSFAMQNWERHFSDVHLPYHRMPSTSPANAIMNLDQKFEIWARNLAR